MRRCALLLIFALLPGLVASRSAADEPVLRIGITTEPSSLSPDLAFNDYEQFVDRLVFDVLVTVAADGRTLVPRLAAVVPTQENGGISKDGLTITYHLRRNVKWQDGVAFTSADVQFSYATIMNPRNNVPVRQGYDLVSRIDAPDPYTAVFHMRKPYAPAVTRLFSDTAPNGILPKHLLGGYADINRVAFNEHPIGTGPYRVTRWNRGQSVEFEANRMYYLGEPKVKRISVRFIPDEQTMINELRTGELDVFSQATVNAYGQIRRLPGIKVALADFHGATNVLINNTKPVLRDFRVRRAIAEAIDKSSIVRKYTFGSAKPATADLPSFMWAFDPRVRATPFDPAAAKADLGLAGYAADASGIMLKDGKALSLVLAYAQNNATMRLIAVQLQSYLKAAGIDLQLKAYNNTMMYAPQAMGGIYRGGNFDLALYTMSLGIDPDSSGRFTCGAFPPAGQNYSRYCSPQMDAAQFAGLATFDQRARKEAYSRSQRALAKDIPIVFLYWPVDIEAYNPRLHNLAPNPITIAWNAHAWSY